MPWSYEFTLEVLLHYIRAPCALIHMTLYFDANISARHAIDFYFDAIWIQFIIGQCVHLMSVKNNKQKVATNNISGVGVWTNFTLN
jgi:hypothetical protein